MNKLIEYLKLLRPQQWYKNLIIFAVPVFSKKLFTLDYSIILGFLSLCLISSSNYIINDIVDKKKDQLNPEKMHRPIASGKIKMGEALVLFMVLFLLSLTFSFLLDSILLLCVLILFINTQLYSFFFKHEVYLDVIMISINFVIRALSGYAFVIAELSHWLIICTFFLAMILASGKRYSEFHFLEEKKKHRKVFSYYNSENLNFILLISTICFVMSLSIFPFFSEFAKNLIFLLPLAVYLCMRYLYLVQSGSKIPRHIELAVNDARLMISGIAYATLTVFIIYIF